MDCQKCKDFRGCPGKEFFSPEEIKGKLCPQQIIWLLEHITELHACSWPAGYEVPAPKRKKTSRGASFENILDWPIEVERRILHCRLDGLMVYLYYAMGFTERQLSKYYGLSEKAVKYRIDAVVWYISGWNFYQRPYRRDNAYRKFEGIKEGK